VAERRSQPGLWAVVKILDEMRPDQRGKTAMWVALIVGFVGGMVFTSVIPPINSWF
jgi:hypothetical protein